MNVRHLITGSRLNVLAVAAAVLANLAVARPALADEGMWTFDNFPAQRVAKTYGFAPSQAWLDHVRRSSVRLPGCSGSFISANGLVMTNHHCVVGCVQNLSTPQNPLVQSGFIAKQPEDERLCPTFEVVQLENIRDVTPFVHKALAGKTGDAANVALRTTEAALRKTCATGAAIRCDLVSLYHGGVYDLYRYKRYTDVRLVFAPEYAIGQFGGDPDNFNFPRFDFDLGLVRVYENGKPVSGNDFLRWSPAGSKAGDLVFVSGNPGGTSRQLTVAQLAFERDRVYPSSLPALAEFRGELEEYMREGPLQAQQATSREFGVANQYKAQVGRNEMLLDPAFFAQKQAQERALRAAVAKQPKLQAAYGSAWDDLARLQTLRARLQPRQTALESAVFNGGLIGYATNLVRAPDEIAKPDGQRLPEYGDQELVALMRRLAANVPVVRDLEERNVAFGLTNLRRVLGTDDPLVQAMLGTESPEQLAHRLVSQTTLDDPKVRLAMYAGGRAAVAASTDPLVRWVVTVDALRRAARKEYESRITAPSRTASEKIAAARFAVYGTKIDPDATFTPRLSYGSVKGFTDAQGRAFAPYTTMAGLFARGTGAPPYAIPQSWLAAKAALDPGTPLNLVSTNDIIGGNSGSPLIDKDARVVGLIFDGNIYSLGGLYGYDGTRNRSVAVDSRALLAGLKTVYGLDRIADEITGGSR